MSPFRMIARCVIILVQLFGSLSSVSALPAGFIDEGVVTRDAIITGAFAPNPRNNNKPMLIISSKGGQIYAVEDPDNSEDNVSIGDFSDIICTNGERGLQSVTPHPKFVENRFIYLFYSKYVDDCPESETTGPQNRVSRYTMDPDTLRLDPSTEVAILETSPAPKKMHNGGSMTFGIDGYLYITTGDGGLREPAYSQDLTNLYGSILRVDENGDAPASNPFTTASDGTGVPCGKNGTGRPPAGSAKDAVCEEIYAYGLRNPFRLAMNPNSVDRVLYAIGDVGGSVWEEISFGGDAHKGANYGWPMLEGPCLRGSKGADFDCLNNNDGLVEPHHYYLHTDVEEGGCVVGSAFVPADSGWPAKYQYLFIDFIFDTMYNLIEDPDSECRDCKPPIPGYINETFYERDIMIDMFFGPYRDAQALYVISRGSGQSIRRIRYTGTGNVAPVANFTASATADINEVIEFDGSASSDGDGDEVSFLWDFGDGEISTDRVTTHAYSSYGQYTAKLTVTDELGQKSQVFMIISVGVPPVAQMFSPELDSRFAVGQEIIVFGNATDARGFLLNDTQISWEVRQHHSNHYHPFLDRQSGVGNGFKLDPAPSPEDFMAADNSFLQIIMYATDSFGLVTNVTRNIYPKRVFITVDSQPRGLDILVDEYPVTTPKNISSWENHKLRLNVVDQKNMTFASWSIGGTRKTNFTVPARNLTNPMISVTFTSNISTAAPTFPSFFTPVFFAPSPPPMSSIPTIMPLIMTTTAPIQKTNAPTTLPIRITDSPIASTIFDRDAPPAQILETDSPPTTAPQSSSDNSIDFPTSSNAASIRQLKYREEAYVIILFVSFYFYVN